MKNRITKQVEKLKAAELEATTKGIVMQIPVCGYSLNGFSADVLSTFNVLLKDKSALEHMHTTHILSAIYNLTRALQILTHTMEWRTEVEMEQQGIEPFCYEKCTRCKKLEERNQHDSKDK